MAVTRTLGVTGGIGSGKSTVCRFFESWGARVFYADEIGRRILVEDPSARLALIELLGPGAYARDGSLHRAWIARRVFTDTVLLARLNEIVHPRVFDAFDRAREQAEVDQVPLLVKEAALLYESGSERGLDAVLVVDAPREVRTRRVQERDDATADDVQVRMQRQADPATLLARADYVIRNVGDIDDLGRCARAVFRHLGRRPPGPRHTRTRL